VNQPLVLFMLFLITLHHALGQIPPRDSLSRQLYITQIAASEALLHLNKISDARAYLDATSESERDLGWVFLKASLDRSKSAVTRSGAVFTTIELSPDGGLLAAGSSDGVISFYEYPGLRPIREFVAHTSSISTLAFSTDGKKLASGGRDHAGEVKVLATDTWREVAGFRCNTGLQEIVISQDGNSLAAFSGKNIEIWDTRTFQRRTVLRGHEQTGYAIDFSPDGKYLLSGSNDQTFKLWDLVEGTCTLTYHGYEDVIYSSKFLTERSLLFTSSQGKVWHYQF
jgi:WD40 repeat protein